MSGLFRLFQDRRCYVTLEQMKSDFVQLCQDRTGKIRLGQVTAR
jgi:hypothetical protein